MGLSEFSLVTLITFLLGAGGGDLLDYVPTDAYWRAKEITVTVDVLTKDLRPTPLAEVADLIAQLDSPDAAVRDAAAVKIRAAGPGAIPALQKETESDILETSRRAKALSYIGLAGHLELVQELMPARRHASRAAGTEAASPTTRMPRPPPPYAALMATGQPYCSPNATTSSAGPTGSSVPGTGATPAATAVRRAAIFSPIASMASGGGPMNVTPFSVMARAKSAFSEKNP